MEWRWAEDKNMHDSSAHLSRNVEKFLELLPPRHIFKRRPLTFGVVSSKNIRKTLTTCSQIYVLFVILIPLEFLVFCSPITSTTLAWKYLNLLFRCLVERRVFVGISYHYWGPEQQVSNEHLFLLWN